jgi:hypothetical protein
VHRAVPWKRRRTADGATRKTVAGIGRADDWNSVLEDAGVSIVEGPAATDRRLPPLVSRSVG